MFLIPCNTYCSLSSSWSFPEFNDLLREEVFSNGITKLFFCFFLIVYSKLVIQILLWRTQWHWHTEDKEKKKKLQKPITKKGAKKKDATCSRSDYSECLIFELLFRKYYTQWQFKVSSDLPVHRTLKSLLHTTVLKCQPLLHHSRPKYALSKLISGHTTVLL